MTDKNLIYEYILVKEHVTIAQICNEFSISESTARRILKHLDDRGKIFRYNGGAFSTAGREHINISNRLKEHSDVKNNIAKTAANIVKDGSTMIILSGTTVACMCQYIKNKHITVITNSLLVFYELKAFPNIKLIILGGLYNHQEAELGGVLSNSSIAYLRSDYLFMGASSFDEKSGFINRNFSVELYRACLHACAQTCALVDSSKYNNGGTSIAATPEQINYLFTDSNLKSSVVETFEQKGVKVFIS